MWNLLSQTTFPGVKRSRPVLEISFYYFWAFFRCITVVKQSPLSCYASLYESKCHNLVCIGATCISTVNICVFRSCQYLYFFWFCIENIGTRLCSWGILDWFRSVEGYTGLAIKSHVAFFLLKWSHLCTSTSALFCVFGIVVSCASVREKIVFFCWLRWPRSDRL